MDSPDDAHGPLHQDAPDVERVELSLDSGTAALLRSVARLERRTLAAFLVESARERATRVSEARRRIDAAVEDVLRATAGGSPAARAGAVEPRRRTRAVRPATAGLAPVVCLSDRAPRRRGAARG